MALFNGKQLSFSRIGHGILCFLPVCLTFFFFLTLLSPFWLQHQFELELHYQSREPFQLKFAADNSGNLFCPEKMIVYTIDVPAAREKTVRKIRTNNSVNSFFGVYLSVYAKNSAVTIESLQLNGKKKTLPVDFKQTLFPVDFKQKSLRIDTQGTAFFSSGTQTQLHIRLPYEQRSFLVTDWIFLLYTILISLAFSLGVYRLSRKVKPEDSKHLLFVCLIFILLLIPIVKINYFGKLSTENRLFAPCPELVRNEALNPVFPKEFERWLNDRISGREKMLELNETIFGMTWTKKFFSSGAKNFPDNDSAFWGKENWLFTPAYNGINSIQNKNRFTDAELRLCASRLEQLERTFMERYKAPVYIMIIPDKERIYEEFYPDYLLRLRQHDESRMEQLYSYLHRNTNLKIAYLYPEMMEWKKNYRLYHKPGTHWTDRGAQCAAQSLLKLMHKDFPHINPDHNGVKLWKTLKKADTDIALMLGYRNPMNELPEEMVTSEVPYFGAKLKTTPISVDYLLSLLLNKVTIKNPSDKNGLKALAITDSFWTPVIPFLYPYVTDYFHFFYGHGKDFELSPFESEIDEYQPDIVIIETTERFLHRFLTIKFGE